MEGPLLVHVAVVMVAAVVWVYRRFFEVVAPRSLKFEQYCRGRPLLAALRVAPGREATLAAALRALLGKSRELTATFAGWPWTHHALRVDVECAPELVTLRVVGCRVLRVSQKPVMALPGSLQALFADSDLVRESWFHPLAYFDLNGSRRAPSGWSVLPASLTSRPEFEPWSALPSWLGAKPSELYTPPSFE